MTDEVVFIFKRCAACRAPDGWGIRDAGCLFRAGCHRLCGSQCQCLPTVPCN